MSQIQQPLTPPVLRYRPAEENHGGGRHSDARPVKEDLLRTCEKGMNVEWLGKMIWQPAVIDQSFHWQGCWWSSQYVWVSGWSIANKSSTCHELNAGLYLQAQKYIQSLPFMPQQDLEKIFRGANPLGGWCTADLIILKFNCKSSSCSLHIAN